MIVLLTASLMGAANRASAQSVAVTATPGAVTIFPGQQNVPVSVTLGPSSYAGPIAVTLTGVPSGITVSPLSLPAGGTGTLMISASVSAGAEGFLQAGPSPNTTYTQTVGVLAVAGTLQGTSSLSLTISISNPAFAPPASAINLPIVKIDTAGVPVVDKDTDVPGTVTITSADGSVTYLPNSSDSDNTATFHVHGNTTANMPKLPYNMKLTTSLDLLNTMGLSCPYVSSGKAKPTCDKSKSYVLLANYDDKTLLRDWAASALANSIPLTAPYLASPAGSPSPSGTSTVMPWAPHSLFVEVYLNGVYEGNYQLIEAIKVDSHRVNITELTETDTTDVTGGYLLEIDQHKDEDVYFETPRGVPIGLIDPDFAPDPNVQAQTDYITNYVSDAENALYADNFTDPTLGWRAYYDEASAINFYIVNDLMGNADGGDFYSSDYLYKEVDNPLIYMGPVWDFDVSSGNVNYLPIADATYPWMQIENTWYVRWFKDPGFSKDVVNQWNLLKNNGVFNTWMASIASQAKTLEKSQANNFGRWPMLGISVWPNVEVAGSYDGEVQYLLNWLQLRFAYLDTELNGKAPTSTTLSVGAGPFRTGSPAAFTAQVTAGTPPTGTVSFISSGVLIGAAPVNGNTAIASISNLPVGMLQIQAVYNGDDKNAISGSAQQAVTVLPVLTQATVNITGPFVLSSGGGNNFTATVIANNGITVPTGSVSFSVDGGTAVVETLSSTGVAVFPGTTLLPGQHALTATYSGDATFMPAVSGGFPIQVAGFSIAPVSGTGSSSIVSSGSPAVYSLLVSPEGAATLLGDVALTVSGLPADVTATLSPTSVSAGSAATTVVLTLKETGNASAKPMGRPSARTALPLVLAFVLLPFAGRLRRSGRRFARMVCLCLLGVGAVILSMSATGCSGGDFPARSYGVTVTATSGSLTLTTTLPLIVK